MRKCQFTTLLLLPNLYFYYAALKIKKVSILVNKFISYCNRILQYHIDPATNERLVGTSYILCVSALYFAFLPFRLNKGVGFVV